MKRKMNLVKKACLLLFLGVAGACTEDVEIELPEVDRRMAVFSVVSPDKSVSTYLSYSQPITQSMGYGDRNWISNAIINIRSESDVQVDLDSSSPGSYTGELPVVENIKYTLEASHSAFETIIATTTIPAEVPVLAIDTATETVTSDMEVERRLLTRIKFKDPADVKNYYMLSKHFVWDENSGETMEYIDSHMTDYGVVNAMGAIVFSDDFFNGKEFTIKYSGNDYDGGEGFDGGDSYVYFTSIDENLYKYIVSVYNHSEGDEIEFFMEPIQVYSNVENGLGVFGSYNSKKYSVQF